MTSRPRAFRLDEPGTVTVPAGAAAPDREVARVLVTEEPDEAITAADGVPVLAPARRRSPWGALLLSALGGLASLAVGVAVERLVSDLFAVAPWLGWVAIGLTALAGVALLAIVARELAGVLNERRIEAIRSRAAAALSVRDDPAARAVARELATFYGERGRTGPGPSVEEAEGEIMDGADRLALAERTLLGTRDEAARRAVAAAARQVSVVTAISPRAIVDVAFVVYAAASLLRRVARIYGGRPGLLGFLRLGRAALSHLAVTGGVAVGDGLLQHALGVGIASRISAKLGEGVLNGLMTARFGLAAIEVCRPLPFVRLDPPRLTDVAGDLLVRARREAA